MRTFAIALLLVSAPALAEPWKCELNHPDVTVVTKQPFEVGPGQLQGVGFTSDNIQEEFQARVKAAYGVEFLHNYYGCGPAPADWTSYIRRNSKAKLLDWKPSFLAGSPAGLTGEALHQAVDPAWDQKVLAEQQRQAVLQAKTAADALWQQGKAQAEFAKLIAEMRKRGRAQ